MYGIKLCENSGPGIVLCHQGPQRGIRHVLERLQPALELLDKYRHPYDVVYTNYVGEIVYEDEYQVAVKAGD